MNTQRLYFSLILGVLSCIGIGCSSAVDNAAPPGSTTAATVLILPSKATPQPQQLGSSVAHENQAPQSPGASSSPTSAPSPSAQGQPIVATDPAVVGPGDAPKYGEKRSVIPNEPYITYEQYKKLKNGMSYEQLAELFQRAGKCEYYFRSNDYSSAIYLWENPDKSYVKAWFTDNKAYYWSNWQLR